MKFKIIILILLSVVFFSGFSNNIQASKDTLILESGIPGQIKSGTIAVSSVTPEKYIIFLYKFMIGLIGIAGFASLVWYGIVWIYSGISEKKSEAMEGIKNTLIGIGLALGSFVILNTINPALVTLDSPKIPKFEANPESKMPKEITTGNRTAGYYYFIRKDSSSPISRYSAPFSSLSSCNKARDIYTEDNCINDLDACDGPDLTASPCEGYKINPQDNYFYWVEYNNKPYVDSGFTTRESCEAKANGYGIFGIELFSEYTVINKSGGSGNYSCWNGEPPSNASPLP